MSHHLLPLILLGLLGCGLHAQTVDTSTLTDKVVCGYQGWFRCEGDGSTNGWHHYAGDHRFEPGYSNIEIWPEVAELPKADRFATPFRHADGRVAEVFSSVRPAVTQLHFKWMRDYDIDGAMVQRFAVSTRDPNMRGPMDAVLTHCQAAAKANGRGWALMYDLSGVRQGAGETVINDWKHLLASKTVDIHAPAYFHHHGKPLVALWGLGFNDRPPMLDDWSAIITFLRDDPRFGGCAIMLGVPYHWLQLKGDTIPDPRLHQLIALADIVSPWAVGRLATPQDAANRIQSHLKPGLAWCAERKADFLPVVFPGFSWQNLSKARGQSAEFDQIPRRGGEFLWAQALAAKQAGARMLYVAMFDELDEGTAIFKTDNHPPVGPTRFLAEPDLPSDHYLWLSGSLGRLLRDDLPATATLPQRKTAKAND